MGGNSYTRPTFSTSKLLRVELMYDILMLAVLLGAVFLGMWKGLAWQVASLTSVVLSYFVASNFWPMLAPMISVDPPLNEFIAMFILFLGTALAVWIVFGFVRKTIESMSLKSWDRQAGALVGAIKGAALCMVITLFAVTLLGDNNKQAIINSTSGRLITKAINQAAAAVPEHMREKIDSYLKKYNDDVDRNFDPDLPNSSIGETIGGLVDKATEKFNSLGGEEQASNQTATPPFGSYVGQDQVGQQARSDTQTGQGNTHVGSVSRGDSTAAGAAYYDAAEQKWVPAPPASTASSGDSFNFQDAAASLREQVTDAVTDGVREAVENRLKGDR